MLRHHGGGRAQNHVPRVDLPAVIAPVIHTQPVEILPCFGLCRLSDPAPNTQSP